MRSFASRIVVSVANATLKEAKITYIRLNTKTPCPPRSAVPAKHGFEIEGVSESVLQRFSKRSAQRDALIREMEQKLGRQLTNDEIAPAVHHSRDRKLKEARRQFPDLVATDKGFSTREILITELALIAAVRDGKSAVAPLNFDYRPADWLSPDQQTDIRHVLRSNDRIAGIRGLAGTGKTTALKELRAACERAEHSLRFCAPTSAATEVLRKEGSTLLLSKFSCAKTGGT